MSRNHRLLNDLAAIEQQLAQLIRSADLLAVNPGETKTTWSPAIDIYETANEFVLTAELPGVRSSDLDIKVVGETLHLRGERRWEPEVSHELYYRLESAYGKFERTFSLAETIDSDRITAELEQGVLKVRLPKRTGQPAGASHEIPVRTDPVPDVSQDV